jgi:hypothetical protein
MFSHNSKIGRWAIAAAAIMAATRTVLAVLGLHMQILCLQFVCVILNHLKISTRFELVKKATTQLPVPVSGQVLHSLRLIDL